MRDGRWTIYLNGRWYFGLLALVLLLAIFAGIIVGLYKQSVENGLVAWFLFSAAEYGVYVIGRDMFGVLPDIKLRL